MPALPTPSALTGEHLVQFYENAGFLARSVASFVADGINDGEAVVLIAKDENAPAFLAELTGRGVNVQAALERQQLVVLSAAETLGRFMKDGAPDPDSFRAAIEPLVVAGRGRSSGVRAYGEMVDLLWREGNREGALQLERLWSDFVARHDFPLLCAYEMTGFSNEADREDFARVCGNHSHVLPTEHLPDDADDDAQNRIIAQLQQRAHALESEIERRQALETERARLLVAAEAAIGVRDDFLSIASHELKTPLTSVQINLEGLLRACNEGELDRARAAPRLERVRSGLDRLKVLVDGLLEGSYVAAGRFELRRTTFNLGRLLEEVASQFDEQVKRRDSELSVSAADVEGNWDRDRLDQVITNLLANALKFGSGGKISATLERQGAEAVLSITDQGPGISSADQARVFERFERASESRNHGGLGLGLWIAREIVTAHGGRIELDSEPGRGSTFRVRLPVG